MLNSDIQLNTWPISSDGYEDRLNWELIYKATNANIYKVWCITKKCYCTIKVFTINMLDNIDLILKGSFLNSPNIFIFIP